MLRGGLLACIGILLSPRGLEASFAVAASIAEALLTEVHSSRHISSFKKGRLCTAYRPDTHRVLDLIVLRTHVLRTQEFNVVPLTGRRR